MVGFLSYKQLLFDEILQVCPSDSEMRLLHWKDVLTHLLRMGLASFQFLFRDAETLVSDPLLLCFYSFFLSRYFGVGSVYILFPVLAGETSPFLRPRSFRPMFFLSGGLFVFPSRGGFFFLPRLFDAVPSFFESMFGSYQSRDFLCSPFLCSCPKNLVFFSLL